MLKEILNSKHRIGQFGQLLKLHQIKPLYKDYHYNLVNTITLSAYLVIQRNRMILNQDFTHTPPPSKEQRMKTKKYNIYMHVLGWNWRKFIEKLNKWAKYNLHA